MLVDTHCHIHDKQYGFDIRSVLANAKKAKVNQLICVGTDYHDSCQAIEFAEAHSKLTRASIGVHPHAADTWPEVASDFALLAHDPHVVAVGECGLDYFYENSLQEDQQIALEEQLAIASREKLPMIFHVRGSKSHPEDAFADFWQLYDEYKTPGVVHSFSASSQLLDQVLQRDLYVGINGIMTFTKNPQQLEAAKRIPLHKLLLETDAPYLTPPPFRGKMNEPKNIALIAAFLAELRGESLSQIASATTANAAKLFKLA